MNSRESLLLSLFLAVLLAVGLFFGIEVYRGKKSVIKEKRWELEQRIAEIDI